MASTDRELHQEFLKDVRDSQRRPVDPKPALTKETLRADLREHLIGQTGSEALADLSLTHLEAEANARVRLEKSLREDLARVDASIARFRAETLKVLAPFEQRLKAAEAEFTAASVALADARSSRDSECARGLGERRNQLVATLRGAAVIQGKLIPWREGGSAPQLSSET
jgi:hypothetical protein